MAHPFALNPLHITPESVICGDSQVMVDIEKNVHAQIRFGLAAVAAIGHQRFYFITAWWCSEQEFLTFILSRWCTSTILHLTNDLKQPPGSPVESS